MKSMRELKREITKLEEEHEAERERQTLLQTGKMSQGKYRDISTAKLRNVADSGRKVKNMPLITLPHILSLYALSSREKMESRVASVPNLCMQVS